MRPALLVAVVALASLPARSDDPKPAARSDGFVPLFNGQDLSGWVNVNCAPGTFFVKDNEIVTTGEPTGFLRTDRQYENFELEFEWMHTRKEGMANSGLFVWGDPLPAVGTPYTRGIEVQVLINYAPKDRWATSHGDIFSIWGARCTPDRPHHKGIERCLPNEERVKGAGQWNHYRVVANDGSIKLSVNGKEVSGVSKSTPRKGYLALESEGAECHFRKIMLKELPSTNPKPDEVAKVWEGHTSLFTGVDLTGWKTEKNAWKAAGGVLKSDGQADLVGEKPVGPCELVFDWKLPAGAGGWAGVSVGGASVDILPDGKLAVAFSAGGKGVGTSRPKSGAKAGAWNRTVVRVDAKTLTVAVNGGEPWEISPPDGTNGPGVVRLGPAAGLEVMNVFARELKGK